jgi:tetratricopeptide (TPR) repeat protein
VWNQSQPDKLLVRYLLGELSPRERDQLEDRYFSDEASHEQLLAIEAELIDSYVRGELSTKQRARFEQRFLQTRERLEKLEFAKVLAQLSQGAAQRKPGRKAFFVSIFAFLKEHVSFVQLSFALAAIVALVVTPVVFLHERAGPVVKRLTVTSDTKNRDATPARANTPYPDLGPGGRGPGDPLRTPNEITQQKDQADLHRAEAIQQDPDEALRLGNRAQQPKEQNEANNQVLLKQQQVATSSPAVSLGTNSVSPSNYDALLAEGQQKLNQGQAVEARALADRLIQMGPDRWEGWALAAQSSAQLNRTSAQLNLAKEAESLYAKAFALAPAEVRPNLARQLEQVRPLVLGALQPIVRGKVIMADGSPPPRSVGIERVCTDVQGSAPGPVTDKKGEFLWRMEVDPMLTRVCKIRATLAGYVSSEIDISGFNSYTNLNLPPLILTPAAPPR